MEKREKFVMTYPVLIHNLFLGYLSLAMLVGIIHHVFIINPSPVMDWSVIFNFGSISNKNPNPQNIVDGLLCDPQKRLANGNHIFWFYVFLYSKFYELIDTVIIVLKKRPIIFLHVYHHCITIILTYCMLENEVGCQWLNIVANVSVHIPMYFYYAISSLGYSAWWKKYITSMQIVQFVVDLSANSIGFFYHWQTNWTRCSGSPQAWVFGQAVLLSFLILFIAFYKQTYKSENLEKTSKLSPESNSIPKQKQAPNGKPKTQ